MGTKTLECDACDRLFVPDPRNAWHQKYCTDPACVLERKKRRQREWAARRKAEDADFAEKARKRCREANRRRRQRAAALAAEPPAAGSPSPPEAEVRHALLGLLAQMADCRDSGELSSAFAICAERGRRLAAAGPGAAMPP